MKATIEIINFSQFDYILIARSINELNAKLPKETKLKVVYESP